MTPSEEQVRGHVGEASYTKALEYVRERAVYDARGQGATLRGRCEGSHGESYHVRATTDAAGAVGDALCTCPVGATGDCKHVAALLLEYRARPQEFLEIDDVDTALRRRGRADLVALVKQMLRQAPDLETLLMTPLPSLGHRSPAGPVSARLYRRQADAVFRRIGSAWGAVTAVLEELRPLVTIGDGFVAQGDVQAAVAVYEGIAEAVLQRYEDYASQDGDSALRRVVSGCVAGLARCLGLTEKDSPERAKVIEELFDVFTADADLGDVGPGDEAADILVHQTTAAERARVAGWIRATSPAGGGWTSIAHAGFLLDLEADALPDEEFLAACRELGRHRDRVERLLTLGRPDEAITAAAEADAIGLVGVANLLVDHCHEAAAEALVARRLSSSEDPHLVEWLRGRSGLRGDRATTLALTERLFTNTPSLKHFREARALALALHTWPEARGRMLASAESQRASGVLTEIALDESDLDGALARISLVSVGLRLRVAQAAEVTRPRDAAAIYQKHIEALIGAGAREQYREATKYLKTVRGLYEALGDMAGWSEYLRDLRARHVRLRALRDELASAGL